MIFSTKNYSDYNCYDLIKINNQVISCCGEGADEKSIKFLGLELDDKLTWKYHIQSVKRKLAKSLFALNQIKKSMPFSAMRTLYFSMINCHLTYGIIAWGNSPGISKLLTLQKQALRFINKASYRAHTDPLFKRNGILKLTDIYKLQAAVFIYDYKHSKLPLSFENFYCSGNVRSTRQSNNIPLPTPRTNFSGGSFYYNVPKIWNSLDITTKLISNKNCFIRTIKNNYKSHYAEQVSCNNPNCIDCNRNWEWCKYIPYPGLSHWSFIPTHIMIILSTLCRWPV